MSVEKRAFFVFVQKELISYSGSADFRAALAKAGLNTRIGKGDVDFSQIYGLSGPVAVDQAMEKLLEPIDFSAFSGGSLLELEMFLNDKVNVHFDVICLVCGKQLAGLIMLADPEKICDARKLRDSASFKYWLSVPTGR